MKDELRALCERALSDIGSADTLDRLEEIQLRLLGRKGELGVVMRGMGKLTPEERPEVGQVANEVKSAITSALDARIEGSTTEPSAAGYTGNHTINVGMHYSGRWEEEGGAHGMAFDLPEMAVGPLSDCSIRIVSGASVRYELDDLCIRSFYPLAGRRDGVSPSASRRTGRPADRAPQQQALPQ